MKEAPKALPGARDRASSRNEIVTAQDEIAAVRRDVASPMPHKTAWEASGTAA